jgi:uncharacterized protein (DUF697 family)
MPNVFGAVGTVRNFMSIVKEVDFDAVRGRAETPPSILVCAGDEAHASSIIEQVFGEDGVRYVDTRTQWFDDIDGSKYDLVIVVDAGSDDLVGQVRKAVGLDSARKVLAPRIDGETMSPKETVRTQDAVVGLNPELAPAIGRRFPALQMAAVKAIVDETSKANAQFALVSNIPAVIPIIGGIVAAGADFIVLTKNQVMMVFKIAAVHDRDLGNQFKLMRELAPVVGTGFLWRTVAREAVSFLPLAAGTIPKVAIAYVGTTVMGRAADYFYRFGKKPTTDQLKEFTRKATETVSRLNIGKGDEDSARGKLPDGTKVDAPDGDQDRRSA